MATGLIPGEAGIWMPTSGVGGKGELQDVLVVGEAMACLLYTSPSPRD